MFSRLRAFRLRLPVAPAAVVLSVVALIIVPTLARVAQRLDTASHAPSFSRNIDCPPKRVTISAALAVTSPIPLRQAEPPMVAPFVPRDDTPRCPSFRSMPSLLRAPPSAPLT